MRGGPGGWPPAQDGGESEHGEEGDGGGDPYRRCTGVAHEAADPVGEVGDGGHGTTARDVSTRVEDQLVGAVPGHVEPGEDQESARGPVDVGQDPFMAVTTWRWAMATATLSTASTLPMPAA